ncbi:MAG: hypothetical protein RKP20_17390 [Candidatus Competibacter sp.]|nr:hypothetical protein [Candidatus Competibacter sp.]
MKFQRFLSFSLVSIAATRRLARFIGDQAVPSFNPAHRQEITKMSKRSAVIRMALVVAAAFAGASAYATANFTGKVNMLEVWSTGNVAFTLVPPVTGYCNNQFIINASFPGAKNLIATLITAKAQDREIQVASYVDSTGCIPADGYGGDYIKPVYLYLRD